MAMNQKMISSSGLVFWQVSLLSPMYLNHHPLNQDHRNELKFLFIVHSKLIKFSLYAVTIRVWDSSRMDSFLLLLLILF